jgi:hypothetical protein
MTRCTCGKVRASMAALLAMLCCVGTALAQAGNQGWPDGRQGRAAPAKQAEGQAGMMAGQQGMGGMGMT